MKAVLPVIRILVVIQIINNVCCQNGFNDQDLMRYQQQMASNDGANVETITGYSTIVQRDPNSQSVNSVNVQYHVTEESENSDDYNRSDRGRRKVIRIKNPFQRQLDENEQSPNVNSDPQDSATGASNQYSAMQYSLPPEEFLQRMKAESQFYQQQQQQQQPVTQAPSLSYTATPQPQYQYSTMLSSDFNANQQLNQISEQDKLSHPFQNNQNYQYNVQSSYNLNGIQSTTPAPSYLSTPISNNNYVITPSNSYVSSAASIMMSNAPNLQQYVSSPLSTLQNASPDYGRSMSSTLSSNPINYDNESIKKMQIDHYDNSNNGFRYPDSIQQQLANNYPTSTPVPSSSPFSEPWQNNGLNSLSKSMQEISLQYQNNNAYNNKHDGRVDQNIDSDTHRIGNMPAANNVYLNYAPPDYSSSSQYKQRTRDTDHETGQPDVYSHGDYGWKLSGKRSPGTDNYNAASTQQRYQGLNYPSDGSAMSQMSFYMDTGKQNKYEQISKSASDNIEAQEFAKAAAKAHQLQQAQQAYTTNYNNAYPYGNIDKYYGSFDRQRSKVYPENSNSYFSNLQSEVITGSPYNFGNNNYEIKNKYPFDHAKAMKGIVPLDVSNVVGQDSHSQALMESNTNKFNQYKEQVEQSLKQFYKPLTDSYYKDKNTIYGFNIQTKPDQIGDTSKQTDVNIPFYNKQQTQDPSFSHNSYSDNKRFAESSSPSYSSQYLSESAQNNNQHNSQRPTQASDIANFLKLNDIPYRLTQGLSQDSLKLHNDNYDQSAIPTPLPLRINQNVQNHQIDVASNILNKLMANNKQPTSNGNRPELDIQSNSPITNINGFKVANPFNVDLKLVADMLKGKSAIDDSQLLSLRDQFNKPSPLKLDFSQLQQFLLKNDNNFNVGPLNDGLGVVSSSFFDVLNSGRYPYQGPKYSRSQEEEESIPIADASNNHPIGAVMEQDPVSESEVSTNTELTAQEDDTVTHNFDESRSKHPLVSGHRTVGDRHRHPNSLPSGRRRRPYQRKYPKTDINEPYPLLKPPPTHGHRLRSGRLRTDSRRRVKKPKTMRILQTEPLFEAGTEEEEPSVSRLLMPPPPSADGKSDVISEDRDA